eukprot:gene11255-12551_t
MFRPLFKSQLKAVTAFQSRILPVRATSSFVQKLDASIQALPHREAVRYEYKNQKFSAEQLNKYTEAHANALLEHGFKAGETILVWMPEIPEKHVLFLAAAKAGLKLVELDVSITSVEDVREALRLSQPKAIYVQKQYGNTDYLLVLRKSIPELFYYDDSGGQLFHSKYFPNLRYFVHTEMDNEIGALNFNSLFLRDPPTSYVKAAAEATKDDTPLYSAITKGSKGVQQTPFVPHGEVLKLPAWSFANKVVESVYFEVPKHCNEPEN